jgi:hypothetical protein
LVSELVAAVAAGAREVLDQYGGETGYSQRWGDHPFPADVLADLEGR